MFTIIIVNNKGQRMCVNGNHTHTHTHAGPYCSQSYFRTISRHLLFTISALFDTINCNISLRIVAIAKRTNTRSVTVPWIRHPCTPLGIGANFRRERKKSAVAWDSSGRGLRPRPACRGPAPPLGSNTPPVAGEPLTVPRAAAAVRAG